MVTIKNEDVYSKVRESLGADASGIDFLPFPDLDQSMRDDVRVPEGLAADRRRRVGARASCTTCTTGRPGGS